jgi:hypothetical protein
MKEIVVLCRFGDYVPADMEKIMDLLDDTDCFLVRISGSVYLGVEK